MTPFEKHQADVARLSRDTMRDRLHDAHEAYAAAVSEARIRLVTAHKVVTRQLEDANRWLATRGFDVEDEGLPRPGDPSEDATLFVPDFASVFDELSGQAEDLVAKRAAKEKLVADMFDEEDESEAKADEEKAKASATPRPRSVWTRGWWIAERATTCCVDMMCREPILAGDLHFCSGEPGATYCVKHAASAAKASRTLQNEDE